MEFEKIKEIISSELNIDISDITKDTSLQDDLSADSLDIYQIVMALEEEFDIEFSNDDAENIKSVQDILDYIKIVRDI